MSTDRALRAEAELEFEPIVTQVVDNLVVAY